METSPHSGYRPMSACAIVKKPWRTTAMNLMNQRVRLNLVGRTPLVRGRRPRRPLCPGARSPRGSMIARRELLQSAAGVLAVSSAATAQSGKRPLSKRLSVMIGGYFGRNVPLEEKLKKLASINYPAVEGVTWKDQDLGAIK